MAGIPPKRPSAIDGYRRLERTRSVVGASLGAAAMGAVEPAERIERDEPRTSRRSSRLTRARVAGAVRLAGFVGVLALIVGTSVSIASADQRGDAKPAPVATERAATTQAEPAAKDDVAPAPREANTQPAETDVDDPAPTPEPAPAVEPEAAAVVADTAGVGTATGAVPAAPLPFTGELQVRWIVLGGSLFVLVGMLVQVAGQPLPARAQRTR